MDNITNIDEINHIKLLNNIEYTIQNNGNTIIYNNFKKEIKNLGIKREQNHGKLIIIFQVIFPEKLSEIQKNKLKTLL